MTTQNRTDEPDRTLFVGNLENRVKEEILYELFLQAGPVSKVTICKDKDGNPKSFGFVCFKHTESVPYAMALLNGIRLYGRPIKVQYRFGSTHSLELSSPSQNMDEDVQASTYRYADSYCDIPLPVSPYQVNNNPDQIYSAIQSMMTCLTQYVPYSPMGQPFLYPQMTSQLFPSIPVSSYMNTGQASSESVYSEAKTHSQYLITKNTPKRKRTLEVGENNSSKKNNRKKYRKK
ncbi:splicing regulator RBM11 [Thamnophis elegans]|uniref:splicing regulator RBM11 n=1 Tax=Thamnophis elegans TaxID=35005 RepID=UPI00137688DA|nr:splicing regulator RBM11 [Thamnophis elegans]